MPRGNYKWWTCPRCRERHFITPKECVVADRGPYCSRCRLRGLLVLLVRGERCGKARV